MSPDRQSRPFAQRVADKWQVPLLALSTGLFASVMLWLKPIPGAIPIEQRVAQIQSMKVGLLLPEAEGRIRELLQSDEYPPQQRGPLWAELADLLFRIESAKQDRQDRDLMAVLTSYEHAELVGFELAGDDLAKRGVVYEWMNQPASALEQYHLALLRAPTDPLDLQRRVLELQLRAIETPGAELHAGLDHLLSSSASRPEILKWALEQKVQMLFDEGRISDARQLLAEHIGSLEGTPHEPFATYLWAWLDYHAGELVDAELRLRDLRSRWQVRDDLDARSGWLLGKILLMDDGAQRPLQALGFFEDVIRVHVSGEYVTAAKLGMAEALSDLQRFDEALGYYREVLGDLDQSESLLVNRRAVSNSLAIRSRLQREAGLEDSAVDYLELATELIDPKNVGTLSLHLDELAQLKRTVAEHKHEAAAAAARDGNVEAAAALQQRNRALMLSAAGDFLALSALQRSDDSAAADALWDAARTFDAAGVPGRTIELLERFLVDRPESLYVPMALHRLGQAYQAEGQLPAAIDRYQRCIAGFTHTEPAQQSIIPLADCFMMLGPDSTGQAEATLLSVLDQDPDQPAIFTPQSNVYRAALFKLGDLYSREGRYVDAIGHLDEALQRYPEDGRRVRATFLLADAYRQSGLEMDAAAAEMTNALRRDEAQAKKRQRLEQAEALFGRVIGLLGTARRAALTPTEVLQLQLSYIYRADCAFDLADYERALSSYQEVARVYADDPLALSAYLQIISCLEGLGRVSEVTPALRRALWLTDKIPPDRFEGRLVRNSPEDWRKLFSWLKDSGRYQ